MQQIDFVDMGGLKVGHAQDLHGATGCSVIICEAGAAAGVDVRGGAPATRETDLLNPVNMVDRVHAILLTGGSAFGLDAAAGVMQYCEERDIGFDVGMTRVPIVCGAALFDLAVGDYSVRPDKAMGYEAAVHASSHESRQGCIGAGTGASVGKIRGMERAMKSGLGSFAIRHEDLMVGALVAMNCLGDVIDPRSGRKIAGLLSEDRRSLSDTEETMMASSTGGQRPFSGNTTIGVVATNASLTKAQAAKVASMAHNGYARTMRPAHSMYDGDTIFALSCGGIDADISVVGMLSARVMERAVVAAVEGATGLCGLLSCADLQSRGT